jgi:adenylate kinase
LEVGFEMMRIVLLGAPGSGKGTQAQRLQAKHGVPQVSSGDLLRDAVARGTELGLKAKAVMDAGQLVSDDIVLGLIRERLSRPDAAQGFILDGFPRNIEQADALRALLEDLKQPLDGVLLLDVRSETLMRRLAGRRICPKCGAVYNVHSLPAGTTTCARDGAELYQRPDDREEVIGKRLEVYEQQTRPLVDYYAKRGLLRVVAGEGELDDVFERMEAAALAKAVPASKVKVGVKAKARKPATKSTKPAVKAAPKSASKSAAKSAKKAPRKAARPAARKAAQRPKSIGKASAAKKATRKAAKAKGGRGKAVSKVSRKSAKARRPARKARSKKK